MLTTFNINVVLPFFLINFHIVAPGADDGEALDASVMSIAMKDVHVDWDLVETIWDAGSYRLDSEKQKFIAVRKRINE